MKDLIKTGLLLLLALLLPASAAAYDFAVNGIYYDYCNEYGTVEVAQSPSSDKYFGYVSIPATVTYNGTTYTVTAIGDWAFYYCYGLTGISIPNSVISIGEGAFYGTGLVRVTIPDNVTTIGEEAFLNCKSLVSATIGNSVTAIGKEVFFGCNNLASVTIGNSVKSIGYEAFFCCESLRSITIPNSVTDIGYQAFNGCEGLTSIDIPNSVASIGEAAFWGCNSLESVNIGNSVTSIGKKAFAFCSGLTNIKVDSGNPKYDSRNECNAIIETSINTLIAGGKGTVIPGTVTSIGDYAFEGSGLTSMPIPNSVTSIGERAFRHCESLTSMIIPNSVTTMGFSAFESCCNLANVTIGTSLTSISQSAFFCCSSLTSVTIPNSVISIGYAAFQDCSSLKSVTIPNSVTSIGGQAFSFCSNLTCVAIPNLVTAIGNGVFMGCSSLSSVLIPNAVTTISNYAFYGCESLPSINIPNSVNSIGSKAFANCSGLTDVYSYIVDPSAISMGYYVFEKESSSYTGCTLHVPQGTADVYRADGLWQPYFEQIVDDVAAVAGRVDFTGGQYPAIEVTPHVSTGWDKIFVLYDTEGVAMTFTATTDDTVAWYRLDYSGGQLDMEEITDITHTGNVTTLTQVIPNMGYRIAVGDDNIYYCWVVNYADYYMELNDLSINNEAPCDLLSFTIDGRADAIPYYTVNGKPQVLDREIKLKYNTLVWDDTYCSWQEQEIVESFAALDQGVKIVPPLCNTVFEIKGDRFLEYWGEEQMLASASFYTQAVDCHTTMAPNDDVLIDMNGELSGSAPLHLSFTGYPTDAVANSAWEIATDPEFENVIISQFNEDELEYTFTNAGNHYVRYRVANATGTCEACSDIYTIRVNKGANPDLPGDVNGDGKVNVSDLNDVLDIILRGYGYTTTADVNGDGEINITDINKIINIIIASTAAEEHECVDLGLPSGTLWATCNIGAEYPYENGDYFAWGETAPKRVYDWGTYKWWNSTDNSLTKYCTNGDYGTVDNKTELDPEDDAAYVNWGPSWRMPTLTQIQELYDYSSGEWMTMDGVEGWLVTGPNGNTMFLPAAGSFEIEWIEDVGTYGNYWTRNLYRSSVNASELRLFNIDRVGWQINFYYRSRGRSVRAVRVED